MRGFRGLRIEEAPDAESGALVVLFDVDGAAPGIVDELVAMARRAAPGSRLLLTATSAPARASAPIVLGLDLSSPDPAGALRQAASGGEPGADRSSCTGCTGGRSSRSSASCSPARGSTSS